MVRVQWGSELSCLWSLPILFLLSRPIRDVPSFNTNLQFSWKIPMRERLLKCPPCHIWSSFLQTRLSSEEPLETNREALDVRDKEFLKGSNVCLSSKAKALDWSQQSLSFSESWPDTDKPSMSRLDGMDALSFGSFNLDPFHCPLILVVLNKTE